MAQIYECTFNNVNGENTGVWTRTRQTKNSPSPGILFKKNCRDNLHFYCDPSDGGNTYYKLLYTELYSGLDTSVGTVYVPLSTSYLTGWKLIDSSTVNTGTSTQTPQAPTQPQTTPAIVPSRLSQTGGSSSLSSNSNININPVGDNTSDGITKYVSYINNNLPSSYSSDYSELRKDINIIEKNLNIALSADAASMIRDDMINKFNRFLLEFPNTALSKTFAHVFFTRPDLNLYNNDGISLLSHVENDPYFYYLNRNSPNILKSLTNRFSTKHDFNPFLSNKAKSFDMQDEYIETGEYGETFTGYKIKYGKHNIKSKTAGSFTINYVDDDNYNIYKIHKAWTDYISKVYRGEFAVNRDNIVNRTIDYAASVYYFLCGPDGETILFWSKYTGVFPTNSPSSASAWSGEILKNPNISINYEFSWKEDMMPTTLAEFNLNSSKDTSYRYAKTYEPELGSTGKTFVNAPFIDTVIDKKTGKYEYKLRFRY